MPTRTFEAPQTVWATALLFASVSAMAFAAEPGKPTVPSSNVPTGFTIDDSGFRYPWRLQEPTKAEPAPTAAPAPKKVAPRPATLPAGATAPGAVTPATPQNAIGPVEAALLGQASPVLTEPAGSARPSSRPMPVQHSTRKPSSYTSPVANWSEPQGRLPVEPLPPTASPAAGTESEAPRRPSALSWLKARLPRTKLADRPAVETQVESVEPRVVSQRQTERRVDRPDIFSKLFGGDRDEERISYAEPISTTIAPIRRDAAPVPAPHKPIEAVTTRIQPPPPAAAPALTKPSEPQPIPSQRYTTVAKPRRRPVLAPAPRAEAAKPAVPEPVVAHQPAPLPAVSAPARTKPVASTAPAVKAPAVKAPAVKAPEMKAPAVPPAPKMLVDAPKVAPNRAAPPVALPKVAPTSNGYSVAKPRVASLPLPSESPSVQRLPTPAAVAPVPEPERVETARTAPVNSTESVVDAAPREWSPAAAIAALVNPSPAREPGPATEDNASAPTTEEVAAKDEEGPVRELTPEQAKAADFLTGKSTAPPAPKPARSLVGWMKRSLANHDQHPNTERMPMPGEVVTSTPLDPREREEAILQRVAGPEHRALPTTPARPMRPEIPPKPERLPMPSSPLVLQPGYQQQWQAEYSPEALAAKQPLVEVPAAAPLAEPMPTQVAMTPADSGMLSVMPMSVPGSADQFAAGGPVRGYALASSQEPVPIMPSGQAFDVAMPQVPTDAEPVDTMPEVLTVPQAIQGLDVEVAQSAVETLLRSSDEVERRLALNQLAMMHGWYTVPQAAQAVRQVVLSEYDTAMRYLAVQMLGTAELPAEFVLDALALSVQHESHPEVRAMAELHHQRLAQLMGGVPLMR